MPLFDVINANIQLFFERKARISKNNVSLSTVSAYFGNLFTNTHLFIYMATVDDKKIIFSMVGVSKIIPQNQKQILKNIYLSFFYGAKIGIIGLNGAGKSTLMKIIAGLEQPTQGEVVWSPGYSVGYLPQDPPLDENKTVKENVMEGVQKIYDALAEYEEINNKFGLEEYYGDLIRWTS